MSTRVLMGSGAGISAEIECEGVAMEVSNQSTRWYRIVSIQADLAVVDIGEVQANSPVGEPKVALLDPRRALVLFETTDVRTGQSLPSVPSPQWAMDWT